MVRMTTYNNGMKSTDRKVEAIMPPRLGADGEAIRAELAARGKPG